MTPNATTSLRVKNYRLTIPKDRLTELQQALEHAARAGQSPAPFVAHQTLSDFLRVTWGMSTFSNCADHPLSMVHVPPRTSMKAFDTFLSLIAPFVSMEHSAYFEVMLQAETEDRTFFYRFQNGQVRKEERIFTYIPAQLEITHPAGEDRP